MAGSRIQAQLENATLSESGKVLPISGAGVLETQKNWLYAWGDTPPTDETGGYSPGCLFAHTDGTSATAVYVNEGTLASCDFNPIFVNPITANVVITDASLKINTLSSTVGNGYPLSESATVALGAYGDDNNAAIGSGTMVRSVEGRLLLAYTAGNREQEAVGVLGKLVSKAGTNRHNMAGVMGSYEVNTSLTVDGQIYSTDTWCQAAVIGRIGAGSAVTTVNSNGVLAGVAAMSNTTSFVANNGIFPAFYAGRWGGTSLKQWDFGIYAEDVRQAAYYNANYGTLPASEKHSLDLVSTATAVSGSSFVGANIKATIAGTAASTVDGLYVNCTQASKAVNGYICAAEFELASTAANASDNSVVNINSIRNHTGSPPAADPYITLRDYGTTYGNAFVRFGVDASDATAMGTLAATAATKLVSQAGAAFEANCDCVVRCMAGTTVFWLLGSTTGPS